MAPAKAYKGMAMEGPIATWYTSNVSRDPSRFLTTARAVAQRVKPGGRVLEVAPGPGLTAIERRGAYLCSTSAPYFLSPQTRYPAL